MSEIAANLHERAKANNPVDASELIAQLQQILERIEASVRQRVGN